LDVADCGLWRPKLLGVGVAARPLAVVCPMLIADVGRETAVYGVGDLAEADSMDLAVIPPDVVEGVSGRS